jgi:2-polyprenyl-6-methoxyphenol hydroxylase-like FAD-dependent oxidoreductase
VHTLAAVSRGGTYDVVISGGAIAGAVAAIRYGRAGLRVALLERSPDEDHFERACTHTISAGQVPLLDELGLTEDLEAVAAPRHSWELYTRYGWIRGELDDYPYPKWNCTVRREVLDPLLRRHAAESGDVDVLYGWKVEDVMRSGRRVKGVVATNRSGRRVELPAKLTVGADGQESAVAEAAGLPARRRRHERFAYWGYFENLRLQSHPKNQIYFLDPDTAYLMYTDSDLVVLVIAPHKSRYPEFRKDPDAFYRRFIAELPDGPNLEGARQVGPMAGHMDMTNVKRRVAAPGVALVGDAAVAADPVWGWGCGWAMLSSSMLAQETADAVRRSDVVLDRALMRYRIKHSKRFSSPYHAAADYSRGRRFYPVEKIVFAAAARDILTARHIHSYVTSSIGIGRLASPRPMLRALGVYLANLPSIHLGSDVPAPLPPLAAEDLVADTPSPEPALALSGGGAAS